MSARVTVLCPGCGGDWTLERPPSADVVTDEACECGAVLELSVDGQLTAILPRDRRAAPLLPDDPGARPPSTAVLVADALRRMRALEQVRVLEEEDNR